MTLQTRIDELERRFEEHGPYRYLFAAVYCNGCGRNESASNPAKLALRLDGWRLGDEFGSADYCPRCQGS